MGMERVCASFGLGLVCEPGHCSSNPRKPGDSTFGSLCVSLDKERQRGQMCVQVGNACMSSQ